MRFGNQATAAIGNGGFGPYSGKAYGVVVVSSTGAIHHNPDLTKLSSGQTGTFTDTASSPTTWTINGTIA